MNAIADPVHWKVCQWLFTRYSGSIWFRPCLLSHLVTYCSIETQDIMPVPQCWSTLNFEGILDGPSPLESRTMGKCKRWINSAGNKNLFSPQRHLSVSQIKCHTWQRLLQSFVCIAPIWFNQQKKRLMLPKLKALNVIKTFELLF